MAPWRWIPPLVADGALQMALDDALLDQHLAGGPPVLRFYGWSQPTLSLGYHQRRLEAHWPGLVSRGSLDLVRRPSGGRAVLHGVGWGGGLTYALVCTPRSTERQQAYGDVSRWLLEGFHDLGMPLVWGEAAATLQRSSCFATSTTADLVDDTGVKRVGSAQLWRRGSLLQHGSILVSPPPGLWREVFGVPVKPLAPLPLAAELLPMRFRAAAERWLCPEGLVPGELTEAELAAAAGRRGRYRPVLPLAPVSP